MAGWVPVASTMARRAVKRQSPTATRPGSTTWPRRARSAALAFEALYGDTVVPVVVWPRRECVARRSPVGRNRCRASHAVDASRLGEQAGSADHHLGGVTAPVRTLAADERRSMPRTVSPSSAREPATVSPPGPMPMTTTSKTVSFTAPACQTECSDDRRTGSCPLAVARNSLGPSCAVRGSSRPLGRRPPMTRRCARCWWRAPTW